MFGHKIPQYQLGAWLLAAVSAPLVLVAGKCPWHWLLIAGVLCGAACWGIYTLTADCPRYGKVFCCLEILWTGIALGELAVWSGYCWPNAENNFTVSITLLLLAAVSAWGGEARASRVGSVLFWSLAILYIVVIAAGTKNLNMQRMLPAGESMPAEVVFVFLLPVAVAIFPKEKGTAFQTALIIAIVFGLIMSLWTVGTLSWQGVSGSDFPFYTFSKSLSLFGVAERLEAFVSVGLTLGFFCTFSLLLSTIRCLTEQFKQGSGNTGVVFAVVLAAYILLPGKPIPANCITVMAILFWGILPLFEAVNKKMKKSKKHEKSP